jgi:hypothetical protein
MPVHSASFLKRRGAERGLRLHAAAFVRALEKGHDGALILRIVRSSNAVTAVMFKLGTEDVVRDVVRPVHGSSV